MHFGNPVECLASALYSAIHVDLSPVEYADWTPSAKAEGKSPRDVPKKTKRPDERDCEIVQFLQSWGSTALGFGGMGGASVTSAYTSVVFGRGRGEVCVYFAGRFAYRIERPNAKFFGDLNLRHMLSVEKSEQYRSPVEALDAQV